MNIVSTEDPSTKTSLVKLEKFNPAVGSVQPVKFTVLCGRMSSSPTSATPGPL